MKNGIIKEDGKLIFYKDDTPFHAGVVKIDNHYYYAGRNGRIATGEHVVHKEMSHGLLAHGTYTFDEEGKMIKGSYRAPKKINKSHSSSSSKTNKKKHKFNKKQLTTLISILLAVSALIGIAFLVDTLTSRHNGSSDISTSSAVFFPTFEEKVNLNSPAAQKLYNGEVTVEQIKKDNPYKPFEFNYQLSTLDGELSLSENPDLSNAKKYILSKSENNICIDNLKTDTTYYYRADVGEESFKGSFKTAEGTRFIYIPGVYNTRDIGGYKTSDGKKIKQDMIIRGTEMDGLVEPSYYLSKNDVESVMNQFNFAYDMDLRESSTYTGEYTSPLGSDVRHKFYTASAHLNIFNKKHHLVTKSIFSDLAKKENYPMYLHCTYGCDRTGTIIYLLQGLLGCSEEDMIKEYQLSGFFRADYADSTAMNSVAEKLNSYPGNNLSEKIEYFLTQEVGVSKSDIQSIRDILLENQ